MTNAALERFALEQLEATRNDDEAFSFLFRTEGSFSVLYCDHATVEELDSLDDLEGLDLPWDKARIEALMNSDAEPTPADLTPEELRQWRHARCQRIVRGEDYHEPKTAWVVPLRPGEVVEGYALFKTWSEEPDDPGFLEGVFPTAEAAIDALRASAEVAVTDEVRTEAHRLFFAANSQNEANLMRSDADGGDSGDENESLGSIFPELDSVWCRGIRTATLPLRPASKRDIGDAGVDAGSRPSAEADERPDGVQKPPGE